MAKDAKKSGSRKTSAKEAMEKAVSRTDHEKYVLRLYITGMTRRSQRALRNIEKICRDYLGDNYELEVIDIYQQPTLAKGEQIVAVPTIIKRLPQPVRRIIGDLSQTEHVLMGLDLKTKDD